VEWDWGASVLDARIKGETKKRGRKQRSARRGHGWGVKEMTI